MLRLDRELMRYRRNRSVITRDLPFESLLVPLEGTSGIMGRLYGVDDIGREIWERLAEPASAGELADAIVGRFEVERETALADLAPFLEALLQRGLIEPAGE